MAFWACVHHMTMMHNMPRVHKCTHTPNTYIHACMHAGTVNSQEARMRNAPSGLTIVEEPGTPLQKKSAEVTGPGVLRVTSSTLFFGVI